MYKLTKSIDSNTSVMQRLLDTAFIPFDPANIDYAKFKDDILKGNAELQDSEGVVMSPDAAKEFVRTLP